MPRAERLMALANLLRGREETTVNALADELQVSRRTLLRDLASLREQGLPITGEAGPGGGIRLEGDRGVLAVHLGVTEIVSMWLAARLSQGASALPWGADATSGMAKLMGVLPKEKARALRSLCQRVVVGEPATTAMRTGSRNAPPELLGLFEEAFSNGRGLGFFYVDKEGRATVRRVEPHGLLVHTPIWYVLARDVEKHEPRMFRMDRISRPRLLPNITFKPDLGLIRAQFSDLKRWRPLTGSWS